MELLVFDHAKVKTCLFLFDVQLQLVVMTVHDVKVLLRLDVFGFKVVVLVL
jgi:hypothetical protein